MTERDEKGRVTHSRFDDGTERWYYYDADGHITHYRLSDGTERWFDADGRATKWKNQKRNIAHRLTKDKK